MMSCLIAGREILIKSRSGLCASNLRVERNKNIKFRIYLTKSGVPAKITMGCSYVGGEN